MGRVAGPLSNPPLDNLIISPLGLVPKSTPGEFRLIIDLSYPPNRSINAGIPSEVCSVQYTSFDAATRMVRDLGQGPAMIKVDIKSAFRLIPIHPSDLCLLGMQFQGRYLVDKALPFGCSFSCDMDGMVCLHPCHRLNNWDDPTDHFLVSKLLEERSRGNRRHRKDLRFSITFYRLQTIVNIIPVVCASSYEAALFTAAFTLAG